MLGVCPQRPIERCGQRGSVYTRRRERGEHHGIPSSRSGWSTYGPSVAAASSGDAGLTARTRRNVETGTGFDVSRNAACSAGSTASPSRPTAAAAGPIVADFTESAKDGVDERGVAGTHRRECSGPGQSDPDRERARQAFLYRRRPVRLGPEPRLPAHRRRLSRPASRSSTRLQEGRRRSRRLRGGREQARARRPRHRRRAGQLGPLGRKHRSGQQVEAEPNMPAIVARDEPSSAAAVSSPAKSTEMSGEGGA